MRADELKKMIESTTDPVTKRSRAFRALQKIFAKRFLVNFNDYEAMLILADLLYYLKYVPGSVKENFELATTIYQRLANEGYENHRKQAVEKLVELNDFNRLFKTLLRSHTEPLDSPYSVLSNLFISAERFETENFLSASDLTFIQNFKEICSDVLMTSLETAKQHFTTLLFNRWKSIINTPLSYTYQPHSALNIFCRFLAAFIDPKNTNILLMPTIQLKEDAFGNKFEELAPGKFIVTEDGKSFIELGCFFDAAYQRIRQGDAPPFFQYINKDNIVKELTPYEKEMMIHSLPQCKVFFSDAEKISNQQVGTTLEVFQKLREGLLKGDKSHEGSELVAASPANLAILSFFDDWYNKLSKEAQQQIGALKNASGTTMQQILDSFAKPIEKASSDNTTYCVQIRGRDLESLIERNATRLISNSAIPQLYNLEILKNSFNKLIPTHEALLQAMTQKDQLAVDILLKFYPDLFTKEPLILLHKACELGFKSLVESLLAKNYEFLNRDIGNPAQTPIVRAALNGQYEIVQLLAEMGAILNCRAQRTLNDPLSMTLVHHAALEDNIKLATILMEYDVGFCLTYRNNGLFPIHIAAQQGNLELVKLFLEKDRTTLNSEDHHGQTALMHAAAKGHKEIVDYLILEGCNLNCRTHFNVAMGSGFTALHWAIENNHPECAESLVLYGANVNIPASPRESHRSPIHLACAKGYLNTVKGIIENDPEQLDQLDLLEQTPVLWAAAKGKTDIVEYLAVKGADLNRPSRALVNNALGFTPLHWAIHNRHYETAFKLIEHHADHTLETSKHEKPIDLTDLPTLKKQLKLLDYIDKVTRRNKNFKYEICFFRHTPFEFKLFAKEMTFFGKKVNFSKDSKLAAARALKEVYFHGKDRAILAEHQEALMNGELSGYYQSFLKNFA